MKKICQQSKSYSFWASFTFLSLFFPLVACAASKGDINSDSTLDMKDAILSLQIISGENVQINDRTMDVDNDDKISLPEALYILEKIAGQSTDRDEDGFSEEQGDCDDYDPVINPGGLEICEDRIDQDCDGSDISCTGIPIVFSNGRIWMDRNLGASRAATSLTDTESFGHLYQWGRLSDGHEIRTSATKDSYSTTPNPGHGDFIVSTFYDWVWPQEDNLWQGLEGVNNPCPAGFRLPTDEEFQAEIDTWPVNDVSAPFPSPLKLPLALYRDQAGELRGSTGYYWTSTPSGIASRVVYVYGVTASLGAHYRNQGFSVRCIKD